MLVRNNLNARLADIEANFSNHYLDLPSISKIADSDWNESLQSYEILQKSKNGSAFF